MPHAPLSPCLGDRGRCGVLSDRGRCPAHRRAADKARGTAHQRGYTVPWATYSREWLARFPWCGQRRDGQRYAEHSRCAAGGVPTAATVTDHIRALKFGGDMFNPANHQSLCASCHARKGITHEGGFGRGT